MTVINKYQWLSLLIFCLLLPVASAADGTTGVLQDFNGTARTLDEYTGKGKWLIVMFWASDCEVCNGEANQYVKFHTAHRDKNATVLGVSLDGSGKKAGAMAFIKRNAINFPNLIGEPDAVAELFTRLTGVSWYGTPTFLFYSPSGELRAQQIGAVPTHLIEDLIKRETVAAVSAKP